MTAPGRGPPLGVGEARRSRRDKSSARNLREGGQVNRRAVWSHADLPTWERRGRWELRLDVESAPLPDTQFGALLAFLQAFYGVDFGGPVPQVDTGEGRFRALLGGLSAASRRLEVEDPEEMEVGGATEVTLHFFVATIEVKRFTREEILSFGLASPADGAGQELRTVDAATRIRYRPDGNVAWVERSRGGRWIQVDQYNPVRTS